MVPNGGRSSDKAQPTESEVEFFLIWLEEAHGSAIHARALQPLQKLTPSLPSRSDAGGIKREATQAPLHEQYGEPASQGWSPGLPSTNNQERPSRKEPNSDADDTSSNPILALDMAAQGGMNGLSLSTLTFVLLTCRLPPQDKDLGYGTDPTMSKAYSKAKSGGHGRLLLDLLGKPSTTGAELHAHFLLASEILRGCGETIAAQRWPSASRRVGTARGPGTDDRITPHDDKRRRSRRQGRPTNGERGGRRPTSTQGAGRRDTVTYWSHDQREPSRIEPHDEQRRRK